MQTETPGDVATTARKPQYHCIHEVYIFVFMLFLFALLYELLHFVHCTFSSTVQTQPQFAENQVMA